MKKENQKNNKKIKKKKKGFTLIELLAVIIILGVLMIIAIPSVTEYINSSRKNAYITTVQGFIDGTTAKVNSLEYSVMDTEVTYYIPTKCISLEKGGDSPFGEFKESYVVVTYDGIGYDYYYTGRDSGNHGILLSYRELLENNFIDTGTKTIDTTVGVGSREKIIIFSDTCEKDLYEEKSATKLIKEEGTLREGFTQLSVPTDASCFEFDSSTGTITNYYCGDQFKDVVIPTKINGVPVKTIGEQSFLSTGIHTIEIPMTVREIEYEAFEENKFLYNIVNKSGRSFDWSNAFGNYNSANFEVGDIIEYGECNSVLVNQLKVTNSRVPYNIAEMFEYSDTSLKLIDSKNYDVFFMRECGDAGWQPFEEETTFDCDTIYAEPTSISQNLVNNFNSKNLLAQPNKYQVQPVICYCTPLKIKVEDNGEILFAQYFRYTGCR